MKTPDVLKQEVEDELAWDRSLDAAAIGVAVTDTAVTLTGHVRNYAQKLSAEKAVRRVAGVIAVANDLEVRLPNDSMRDDSDIAQAIASEFKWNINVPDEVRATVNKGWVTITGTVDWDYQRRAAERAVRALTGVKGLTNLIAIRARPTSADVRDKIYKAFHRSAQIDADNVTVTVHDGTVTLTGTVRNWSERSEAQYAAADAPGVIKVENKLRVETMAPMPI